MKKTAQRIESTLKQLADPTIAMHSQRFFKTARGEYGEGDVFLGIRVPVLRKNLAGFSDIPLAEIRKALCSCFHEVRLFALLLLVKRFKKGNPEQCKAVYRLYLDHTAYINNWDLVDSSAGHIVGAYLMSRQRDDLYRLARSKNLWERRISIIATSVMIKSDQFDDALEISKMLLNDEADLIHKAVGWMLREIGKRDVMVLKRFLNRYHAGMPRTMLRYAIERLPEQERKAYLSGDI